MSRFAPALRQLARPQVLRSSSPAVAAPALSRLHSHPRRTVHNSPTRQNLAPAPRPHLLPEFSLKDKVIVVSGGARGLGLVQAEALLEAGATGMVHKCLEAIQPG